MKLIKRLISFAVMAAMFMLGVTPASATTGTWATPSDVTFAGERLFDSPQIAVDSTGLATAVWSRQEDNGVDYTIRSSTSLNGGPWSTPTNVSAVGENNSEPKIAVDASGLAIVVWVNNDGHDTNMKSSSRPRDGSWSTAVDISAPGFFANPSLKLDSTGLAFALWHFSDGTSNIIQSSSRALNGVWSSVADISDASRNSYWPQVAFDTSGVAFVVWDSYLPNSGDVRVEISSRSLGGSWTNPEILPASLQYSWSAQVVVGSDGAVTLAWVTSNNSRTVVESVIRQPNGTFANPQDLSGDLNDAYDVKLVAGLNGSTIAVWFAYEGGMSKIQSATRSGAGVISGPIDLSDVSNNATAPDLAIDGNGLATAVWRFYDGNDYRIQSRTLQNGSWSSAENLSAAGQDAYAPKVAANTSGRTVVVWEHDQGPHNIVQARSSLNGGAWSNTANVSPAGRNSNTPRVVVDSNGLATMLFRTNEYDSVLGRSFWLTKSSTSFRGGAWSAPVTVSSPGEYSGETQLSVDRNGLVTAIFFAEDATSSSIKSSTSYRGGAWSTPVTLSQPGHDVGNPQIAADANGLATAVWRSYDGTRWLITSRTSLNGGAWSAPITIDANSDNGEYPVVTSDSNGLATAIWLNDDGTNRIVQSSKSLNGGTWSPAVNLSRSGFSASEPAVHVNSNGLVSAVWSLSLGGSNNVIESSTSLGSGAWSNPVTISSEGEYSSNPDITVESSGRSIAVWRTQLGGESFVQAKTRSSAGNWSNTSTLSTAGPYVYDPQVTADGQGMATAIWTTNNGRVETSTSLSGGTWTSTVLVSSPNTYAYQPTLAVDSNGLVTAAWATEGSTVDFIQASSIQNTIPAQSTYSNWSGGQQNNVDDAPVVLPAPVPAFNIKPLAVAFGSKTLTINGNSLTDVTSIKIAGKAAKIIQKQSGDIVVEMPSLAEGYHDVEVAHATGVITLQGMLQIVKPYELKRTQTITKFKGNVPPGSGLAALKKLYLRGTTANIINCFATVASNAPASAVTKATAQAKATCQAALNFSVQLMTVNVRVSKTGKAGSKPALAVTFDRTLTGK